MDKADHDLITSRLVNDTWFFNLPLDRQNAIIDAAAEHADPKELDHAKFMVETKRGVVKKSAPDVSPQNAETELKLVLRGLLDLMQNQVQHAMYSQRELIAFSEIIRSILRTPSDPS